MCSRPPPAPSPGQTKVCVPVTCEGLWPRKKCSWWLAKSPGSRGWQPDDSRWCVEASFRILNWVKGILLFVCLFKDSEHHDALLPFDRANVSPCVKELLVHSVFFLSFFFWCISEALKFGVLQAQSTVSSGLQTQETTILAKEESKPVAPCTQSSCVFLGSLAFRCCHAISSRMPRSESAWFLINWPLNSYLERQTDRETQVALCGSFCAGSIITMNKVQLWPCQRVTEGAVEVTGYWSSGDETPRSS